MGLGPVELVFIRFPGSQFNGGILPALEDVVDRNIAGEISATQVHVRR